MENFVDCRVGDSKTSGEAMTIKGVEKYGAHLEVGDHFWFKDFGWLCVTDTYLHPQSPYNKLHADTLDGSVVNLYLRIPLAMKVTAKGKKQVEADTRAVSLNKAVELAERLRQELMDYAQIQNVREQEVMVMGVKFPVASLRMELSKRLNATQNQLNNVIKQL